MSDQKPLTGLETTFSHLLSRRRSRSLLRQLTTAPPGTVDFSSNDYLSLSTHPEIRSAFLSLLQAPQPTTTTTGTGGPSPAVPSSHPPPPPPPPIGSRGSRLLDGNHPLAARLESLIAAHHRSPGGLLFNSGFDANVGLFSCVPQPGGDYVVHDALIHASVHDGMRLSRVPAARRLAFAHNDAGALRGVLRGIVGAGGEEGARVRRGEANVFVAVEAVYSMDGDVAPLRAMLDVVDEVLPRGNGYVIVDEAHATGVFGGEGGRGLACEVGVEERVFARVVTFGKALGSQGAIVLCSPLTRSYLINYARTLIYTTALSHPSLASIAATYDFLIAGKTAPLLTHLHTLIRLTHALLAALIARLPGPKSQENEREPPLLSLLPLPAHPSPILPLFTPHPRALAAHCQRRGYTVRAIVAPTVPRGAERVRVCLHAGNTIDEVRGLVGAVEGWVRERLGHDDGGDDEGRVGGGEGGGGGMAVVGEGAVLEKARL